MHRFAKQIATFILVTALATALSACKGSQSASGGAGSDVAATVNGKNIMLSEVDRLISQQTEGKQAQMAPLQLAAARLQVLDNLIQRQVLYQKAEKEKTVPKDEEVDTAINAQKTRFTTEEWEKNLKENNLTEQQLRDEARKDLAIKTLQDKLFGKISIRDQEIVDFYNSNKEQFVNSRGVFISDIVSDPLDSTGQYPDDAKSDTEAKAKIDRIYALLKTGGADFATVARASSEDQSNIRGGDVGFATEADLKQNGFPPELVARFFGPMPVGGITEPIRFGNGRWYIFKLTNRQLQNENLSLDSPGVRDKIKEALISQRQTLLNEALLRTAMTDAQIVNNLAVGMLNDPSMLGGTQPVAGKPATTPAAASASPSASATPAASSTPVATATPHATQPAAAATPRAATPVTAATPRATPQAKPASAATPAAQGTKP
ncbi:MAG: SurA N-terminal domain-containing protein [Acidobacteria bacterium]|nr:SurA N-terminal domain-containing protein [Acidobacteriota bacterium]